MKYHLWLCGSLLGLSAGFALANSPREPALDPLSAALEAELALIDDDYAKAAKAYAQAADATRRVDYAERATQLALYAEDAKLAAKMARLWHELAPTERGAAQASALAELRLGREDAAIEGLQSLLQGGTAADLEAVLRTLSSVEQKPGLKVLRVLAADAKFARFEPAELSPVVLAARWGDLKLARQLAEESIKAHPKSGRAWLWRALVSAAAGDKTAAAADYAKALQLDPGNVELRLSYLRVLNDAGRTDELRKLLEDAPTSDPTLYAARLALAVSQTDQREYKKLRRVITRDDSLEPGERSFLLGQISELLEEGPAALEHYRAVTAIPRRYDARLRMAVLQFDSQREQAIDWLREIQESGADQAQQAYLLEAELLNAAGVRDQAILALSRGLSVYLDDTQLLYARALAYAGIDALEQTEADLRRVLELDPENAAALNALGYTLTDRTERHDEAYELIKRAYALNDEDPATLDSLGWVLFRLGRTNESLEYLHKAYQLAPDAEIAAHLGEVLVASGDRPGALDLWRKVLDRKTPQPALQRTLQRLAPELLQ